MKDDEKPFEGWGLVYAPSEDGELLMTAGYIRETMVLGKPGLRVDVHRSDGKGTSTSFYPRDVIRRFEICPPETARAIGEKAMTFADEIQAKIQSGQPRGRAPSSSADPAAGFAAALRQAARPGLPSFIEEMLNDAIRKGFR